MRVALQRQAEMADVLRAVSRLRLGPQNQHVDQLGLGSAGDAGQYPVEQLGAQDLALGQADAGDVEIGERQAQRLHPLRVGGVMDTIKRGAAPCLQLLRGGDVGEDHELLDQPVAGEALSWRNRRRLIVGAEGHAVLDKVEFQCAAGDAGAVEHGEGAVKRVEPLPGQGQLAVAVARRLHLLVGQPRRRAHDRTLEAVAALAAVAVDPEVRRKAGAIFARFQASTARSTAPRGASAPPGRRNRPSCRAVPLRGRARCRARRTRRHRRSRRRGASRRGWPGRDRARPIPRRRNPVRRCRRW